jgi:DNA invertase Pin-like site-specific DNA recombinase
MLHPTTFSMFNKEYGMIRRIGITLFMAAAAHVYGLGTERDILRDRVKVGMDQARKDRKSHGRPMTAGKLVPEMKQLRKDGISKRAIAEQLGVSRTSVIRLLRSRKRS